MVSEAETGAPKITPASKEILLRSGLKEQLISSRKIQLYHQKIVPSYGDYCEARFLPSQKWSMSWRQYLGWLTWAHMGYVQPTGDSFMISDSEADSEVDSESELGISRPGMGDPFIESEVVSPDCPEYSDITDVED